MDWPALYGAGFFCYIVVKGVMYMDISWMDLISSVGFPIVCCVYLIWNQNKADERHKEEVEKLRNSLDNNTKVMNKILRKLNIDDEDEEL